MGPTLVILAAGMGNRYGGLKQIDAFGPHGESIIDYSVFDAFAAGFKKVVFIIRHSFREEFEKKITSKLPSSLEVHLVDQPLEISLPGITFAKREKPRGVTHAMLMVQDIVREPFALINSDDYYGRECFRKAYDFLCGNITKEQSACIGYVLQNTLSDHGAVNRGVCQLDERNLLVSIKEHYGITVSENQITDRDAAIINEQSIVSMNFRCFHPHIFAQAQSIFNQFVRDHASDSKAECPIPDIMDILIKKGEIFCDVLTTTDQWCGVTNPSDKAVVQKIFNDLVDRGVYKSPLWADNVAVANKTIKGLIGKSIQRQNKI